MNILIIGAGRIGRAFEYMVQGHGNGATIEICDSVVGKCPEQRPLAETAPTADIIFLCTLSTAVREVLSEIAPLIKPSALVVSVVKGIEQGTHKTMDTVIEESLKGRAAWCMIIGPMLAEEIIAGQGSAGVVASHDVHALELLRTIISPRDLHLEFSTDVRGVALSGVLKNIFALGLGIADGLGWGANRKGWLMTRAIIEMRAILGALGGDPVSADGPAGLGDLVATGTSPHSRNRATGHEIVTTGLINPTSEGVISCASLRELLSAQKLTTHLIFLETIFNVMLYNAQTEKEFEKMLLL